MTNDNTFFKKTSTDFGDFRVSTICLDTLCKNGCRHWVLYRDGKTDQLSRSTIIDFLVSKNIPLPRHFEEKKEEKKEKKEKKEKTCTIL